MTGEKCEIYEARGTKKLLSLSGSFERRRSCGRREKRINQRRWRALKGLALKYHHREARLNRSSVETANTMGIRRGAGGIAFVCYITEAPCLLCLLRGSRRLNIQQPFPHTAHDACMRAVYRVYKQRRQPPGTLAPAVAS